VRAVLIHADERTEGQTEKNRRTNGRDEGNKGDLKLPPRMRCDLRFLGYYAAYSGIPHRRFGTSYRSHI
jgi:hypothetical protein